MIVEAALEHHRTPSLGVILVLIVIGLLYAAWRSRRLGNLRALLGISRLRREMRDDRISPFAFLPLVALVIVVVVLLIAH